MPNLQISSTWMYTDREQKEKESDLYFSTAEVKYVEAFFTLLLRNNVVTCCYRYNLIITW